METEDSEEQVCPFCGFRLKNFAELKDHIVTYHKMELKEVETSDNVLTDATLEKLQRQTEIEKAQEIGEKYPLAPIWRGVTIIKESPEDLEYFKKLQNEERKKSYIKHEQIPNKLKKRKIFSIRRERWKSDIKALGTGVGAGAVLMIVGGMFNVSSFIGLLGACIVAGVLSWKGRRVKNVVFAGVIMFMVLMCI